MTRGTELEKQNTKGSAKEPEWRYWTQRKRYAMLRNAGVNSGSAAACSYWSAAHVEQWLETHPGVFESKEDVLHRGFALKNLAGRPSMLRSRAKVKKG